MTNNGWSANYRERAAVAAQWYGHADRALASGRWRPTVREQQVVADLMAASRPVVLPTRRAEMTTPRQIAQLARIAPMLRLGLGGLDQPQPYFAAETPAPGPPPPDKPATLARLLAALHGEARCWELLYYRYVHSARSDADVIAGLTAVPDLPEHLRDGDKLWFGMISVGVLFSAIATGDID